MTETFADLIACEDVLMFVNAAITSTGQREFHSGAAEQRLSLDFLHHYVLTNYRELYTAALALDINHHNAAAIIRNLLLDGIRRPAEGALIGRRLRDLPPQRVYRLFGELRKAGAGNNRRTRAIIREWLAGRDLVLDAVKYRAGLKAVLRHAHLPTDSWSDELGAFLFRPHRHGHFRTPLWESWVRAHYERRALYELPYTVAEGLAAKHGIDRATFMDRIAPQLTRQERLRLQESSRALKVGSIDRELAGMPLTRLATYVLGLSFADRVSRRGELTSALRAAARRSAGAQAGRWGRVAAVLDDSFSSYGSGVKRRRPLAVALACHHLLEALAGEYTPLWTSGRDDPLMVGPYGPTPLGARILDALDTRPDSLIIVSDGWDNAPPGLAAEVLRVWRTRLDPARRTRVVHLNPVYDAVDFDVRRLAPTVPTAGIRDAEDLPVLVELAGFAEGRTGLTELAAYLANRVDRYLEAS